MVLKTYSNTESSPTSSTAWWDSVSLDVSKCRRVGDGECNSLWFSILTLTLRLSVSPLLHVGPNHVHFCQLDPGNSWTLGTALQTSIYFALTWHDIQIHFFLWFFLSLQEMSHAYPCANYQLVDSSWYHLIHVLPRISSHTLFLPGITQHFQISGDVWCIRVTLNSMMDSMD